MAQLNEDVAALLSEYAELLQITGGDPFRARNYEKAAKSVAGCGDDLRQLDDVALRQIPGVGASIAKKIIEFRQTGTIAALEELRGAVPKGVRELTRIPGLGPRRAFQLCTRIPGLGPRRAFQLCTDLGISPVSELMHAIDAGQLRD